MTADSVFPGPGPKAVTDRAEIEASCAGVAATAPGAAIQGERDRERLRQHERSVSEQRAFLRQVIDINPHLIFAKDREGRFTLVNQALAELDGTTVEALEGKLESELDLPSEESERYRREDLEVMASGREMRIPRGATTDAKGALRWFETVKRPLVGADGEIAQVVLAVATEITGRIRADEERAKLVRALEDAAREWTESFDAVDAGIVLTGPDGEIMRLNRKAIELIAREAHYRSFLGHHLETISPSEPWRSAAEERRKAARALAPCARQIRDEATGNRWDVLASPVLRRESTSPWVIVTVRDVTTQVELEEQLRRARHLEAMGALVAAVAHEVRSPLFGITATLDALEASLGTHPEYQEAAALLHSQVRRLTQLMNDLLDYGKPAVLHLSTGGIADIVRRAVRACAALAERAGVTVTIELAESPLRVSRDSARLEQVVQNLVANAVQHSPPGGTVRVAVCPATGPPPGFCCTVEDEGPGIAEGDFTRIFEPFVSRRKGGTGLGLSIVQRIVEGHGGRVTAANRAKGGAMFTVTLPAAGDEDAEGSW